MTVINSPSLDSTLDASVLEEQLGLAGHVLEGTDMVASMGHEVRIGNNTTIALQPDTREEAEALFAALSEGATDVNPLTDMFWGDYWGTCLDRFGVRWMFDVPGGASSPD